MILISAKIKDLLFVIHHTSQKKVIRLRRQVLELSAQFVHYHCTMLPLSGGGTSSWVGIVISINAEIKSFQLVIQRFQFHQKSTTFCVIL